jgi:hypothetical protein
VDASDAGKTEVALHMYGTIFSWLPVKSSYKGWTAADVPAPYLTFLQGMSGGAEPNASQSTINPDVLQAELDALSSALVEWLPLFMDKLFLLLEGQEDSVKGVHNSPVTPAVGMVTGHLFAAMASDEPLRKVIINTS